MSMNFGTDLLPTTSGGFSLGSSNMKWNVYASAVNGVSSSYSFSIQTSGWSGTGPFTYNLTAANATANSKINVDIGSTFSNLTGNLSATPAAGKITFSTAKKPSGTISGTVEVINVN